MALAVQIHDRSNPYDEVPYKSVPIEWTAPERLALAALVHGGPRAPLEGYRMLELGCGDGANLLPLACYRHHATFVGVDGARSQIDLADRRRSALSLHNVKFIHADFLTAAARLSGHFDYIVAHGVLSWVSEEVRDALLELCANHLRQGGLLYLNYNTKPGWNVRGMVREFLLAQTAVQTNLALKAREAQEIAATLVASMTPGSHPYSRLIADEFRFVCESDTSYVAHEYLAAENHAYWRSEFLALARRHAFEYVADADFNYGTGRVPEDVTPQLVERRIIGRALEDTVDLLCYRQLHSPIFTASPFARARPDVAELARLRIASCLVRGRQNDTGHWLFQHPSGYEVEAKADEIADALATLRSLWPGSLVIGELFSDAGRIMDDLMLLHRSGLIELRFSEPEYAEIERQALNRLESHTGGYVTSPYHTRDAIPDYLERNGASCQSEQKCGR